jgi:hypothetical protein
MVRYHKQSGIIALAVLLSMTLITGWFMKSLLRLSLYANIIQYKERYEQQFSLTQGLVVVGIAAVRSGIQAYEGYFNHWPRADSSYQGTVVINPAHDATVVEGALMQEGCRLMSIRCVVYHHAEQTIIKDWEFVS